MKQNPATAARLSESELDQIRMLIENRSAILFDSSRERFFSTHVREYLAEKGLASGNDLLGLVRGSSIEYEALLENLLTQETSFFRYPAVNEALATKILPEVQDRKFWKNTRTRGADSRPRLDEAPPARLDNYFEATKHGYQVKPRIRRMISFAQMNLADSVYVGKIDVIFCMNVVMYFSEERR